MRRNGLLPTALGDGFTIDNIAFAAENSRSASRGAPVLEVRNRVAFGTSAAAPAAAPAAAAVRGGETNTPRRSGDSRRDAGRVDERERLFDGIEASLVVDPAAGGGGIHQP